MKVKKKATKSKDLSVELKDQYIWSETDAIALIAHISTYWAKAEDRMNFDRTFWVTATKAVASVHIEGSQGADKSLEAYSIKWSHVSTQYLLFINGALIFLC